MKLAINTTFTDKAKQEEFSRIVRTFENVDCQSACKTDQVEGETASKIDHPLLCAILRFFTEVTWGVMHGNRHKDSPPSPGQFCTLINTLKAAMRAAALFTPHSLQSRYDFS